MTQQGVSRAEIDLFLLILGWHEKMLHKDMQNHYEGMSLRDRMKKARITSMM